MPQARIAQATFMPTYHTPDQWILQDFRHGILEPLGCEARGVKAGPVHL